MTGFDVNNAIRIRTTELADYDKCYQIWQISGIFVGASDTPEEFERLLGQNENTCLTALVAEVISGCVLGGFDGRRGLVHHLAVHPEFRGRGIGRMLMEELDIRFREMGVVKYSFWIEADNLQAVKFYEHLGYELRDLITMSKTIRK